MKTTRQGRLAENIAACYLVEQGYTIIERNWRHPSCEIDIIAKNRRSKVVHFIEVRYRKRNLQGGGLLSISHTKRRQMKYAALVYLYGRQQACELGVIELSGNPPKITAFLDQLDVD